MQSCETSSLDIVISVRFVITQTFIIVKYKTNYRDYTCTTMITL